MVEWTLLYTSQANKDAKKLSKHGLKKKAITILEALKKDPYAPPCEKLIGDLKGAYSKRINIQRRIVYQVYKKEKSIKIIRMWSHYE